MECGSCLEIRIIVRSFYEDFFKEFWEGLKVIFAVVCYAIFPIATGVFSLMLSFENYFNSSISVIALFIFGSATILFGLFSIWFIGTVVQDCDELTS